MSAELTCYNCKGTNYVKNGHHHGRQRYKCKNCGCQFTDKNNKEKDGITKSLAIALYLAGVPYKHVGSIVKENGEYEILSWVRSHGFNVRASDPEKTKDEWHKKRYPWDTYMYHEWQRLKANRKETNELQAKYCIPYSDGKMPIERDRSFVRDMETVIDYMRSNKSSSVKRYVVFEVHKYSGEVKKVAITP